MRTTVDLPDAVYRRLKVRAGLRGISLKQLLLEFVQRGLREAGAAGRGRRAAAPIAIPAAGRALRGLGARAWRRMEEREDEARAVRLLR